MTRMNRPLPLIRSDYSEQDTASVTRFESRTDMADYHRHLESIHNTGLHGWGIAAGLQVTATIGGTTLTVAPGIAVQGSQVQNEKTVVVGKHISLASDGFAAIGDNDEIIRVSTDGVRLFTDGLTGEKYLAIQFYEFFDSDTCLEKDVCNIYHAPRVRLLDAAPPDDGSWLVLAGVQLDVGGRVLAISAALRQPPDLPAGSLHLWQARATSMSDTSTVEDALAGELTTRQEGGLTLAVAQTTDELHLGAQTGNMARLSLAAQQIVATRASDSQETIRLTPEDGAITLGAQGTPGVLRVNDAVGNTTITLRSGEANLTALKASGAISAGSLLTTGEATIANLKVSGAVSAGSLSTTGKATIANLKVSGNSDLEDTTIQGDLTGVGPVGLLWKAGMFDPGTYTARTDGLVIGTVGKGVIKGTTDGFEFVADDYIPTNEFPKTFLMPVRKGDNWTVELVRRQPGGIFSFWWRPYGQKPFAETFEKVSEPQPEEKLEEKTLVVPAQQLQQLRQLQQIRREREQDMIALVDALESLIQHPDQKSPREQLLQTLHRLFQTPAQEN